MKQTGELDNACGIIAALHCVYNNLGDDKIQLIPDSVLASFHSSIQSASPAERATALENYNDFKQEYRKVATQGQSSTTRATGHHFTAFVINEAGHLVELCGCKEGPLIIQENCTDVLKGAAVEVQRRFATQEITDQASVMALHGN